MIFVVGGDTTPLSVHSIVLIRIATLDFGSKCGIGVTDPWF